MARTTQATKNDGTVVTYREFDDVNDATTELGAHKVVADVNAQQRRRAMVNEGRKQQTALTSALRRNPELMARIMAELDGDENES